MIKNFTKFTLLLLIFVTGGVKSVNAENVKLYCSEVTVINSDCAYDTETHLFTWNGTSNNTARIFQFKAGTLKKFSKLHLSFDLKTDGGNLRLLIGKDGAWKQFYYDYAEKGDKTIEITLSSDLNESELLNANEIRIGGNSSVSSEQVSAGISTHSLELIPSNVYLDAGWEAPMNIASAEDWTMFSSLIDAGLSNLDANLTSDFEVTDGTMIGSGSTGRGSSNPKAYSGTFNGQNYTITFNSAKTTASVTAPFRFVNGATIRNLNTAGSMSSTNNIMGGIVGFSQGTVVIEDCSSSMNLSTDDTANDATIGGIAGLQDQATTTLTIKNCLYTGNITGHHGISGISGYHRNGEGATISNVLFAGTVNYAEGASNIQSICRGGGTVANSYYRNVFGENSTEGSTSITEAQLANGEVAYNLQDGQASQHWGQDIKAVSSIPMLTDNADYKVFVLGGGEYANWTNTISDDADWVIFSKLVADGQTSLNVTMTADVNAGSTMVGSEWQKYSGTFDGTGHTLTFNYDGNGSMVAPFKEVDGATIKDLKTTGSITSSNNLLAGIVGQVNGATTLTRCASNMSIKTTVDTNGRIGGLVARNGQAGASLTFNNCMYDGEINSATNQAAGFVGWSPNATTISNCLVASTSITGGESNFTPNSITIPDGKYAYYLTTFGTSTQGTQLNKQLLTSGQAAWELNQGIGDGAWFFGQGNLNTSMVDDCPALTNDNTKKVVRTQAQYTGTKLYVNPGGAIPNAVRLKALGWYTDTESKVLTSIPSDFAGGDDAIKRTKNYFKLKVGSAGSTTLMVPFTTTSLPENVKAYDLTFDGTEVTATKVDVITANKPVLINAPVGEYLFSADATGMDDMILEDSGNGWIVYGSSTYTNGALTGVYNEAGSSSASDPFSYVPAGDYVLQNGADGLGFYKVDAANTIKITSFRAYLTASTNSRSLRIVYANDETTGIADVRSMKEDVRGEYFNLKGQRVAQPTKGLYVQNGKKYIVK